MSYIQNIQVGSFYGYNQIPLTSADNLPPQPLRKMYESIYVGADITDPFNAQDLYPGMWWWNTVAEEWISWATAVPGTGTVTSVAVGAGLTTSLGGAAITGSGTILFESIADYGVLSNISGATAAPISNTMTDILDYNFGSAIGEILQRGPMGWETLSPGPDGYVLTTHAADQTATWELNASDASQWSLYPALANVNMNGYSIYGPDVTEAVDLTISLPNISSGTDNGGTLLIYGGSNSGSGDGANIIIRGGQSDSGLGGSVTLQGGDGTGDNTGTAAVVSSSRVVLSAAANYQIFTDDPELEYSTVILGANFLDEFYGVCSNLEFVVPGTSGYVWTSNGPGVAPSWQLNAADASQWANYAAVAGVNINNHTVYNAPLILNEVGDIQIFSNGIALLKSDLGNIALATPNTIYFGAADETPNFSLLSVGAFSAGGYGNLAPVQFIGPATAGYVLTTNGPGSPATWQANSSDASQWATFAAVSYVNLNGYGLKGPERDTAQSMVIALPDLSSGSTDDAGALIIGGDQNSGTGAGSLVQILGGAAIDGDCQGVYIYGGLSTNGEHGPLTLFTDGSAPLNLYGSSLNFLNGGAGDDYATLTLGPSITASGSPANSLVKVTPGAAGTVWTSNGPGVASSWQETGSLLSIVQGAPTGDIDGSNVDFTIAFTPIANSLLVFLNGVMQTLSSDYTFTGTTITFDVSPIVGDRVEVYYIH